MWETRVAKGGLNGGVQWGMAADGEQVYAATSDLVAIRTLTARVLDSRSGGGLTALKIADGSKAWQASPPPCGQRPNCSPAQLAALTAIPGVVFTGLRRSSARALDTRRIDHLGLRHGTGLQDGQRRQRERRSHRRPWHRRRQRYGVHQFRLYAIGRTAR